jgi:hypothetical protein
LSEIKQGKTKYCSWDCYCTYNNSDDPQKQFWDRIRKTETCWVWIGGCHSNGYGSTIFRKKQMHAHRLSWEINCGPIPDGMMVCHRCDNPPCVRPDHLFLGDAGDNSRDRTSKGRQYIRRGEDVPSAKLVGAQIKEIRLQFATGAFSQQALADAFGVSRRNIRLIVRQETWKHL